MRFTPQICCATKLFTETVRKKFTKADAIKRLMREHKECFGALLETKREKTRRLKLEKKGATAPVNVELGGNSELEWMLKVSVHRLQLVKIHKNGKLSIASVPPKKTASVQAMENNELSRVQTRIIQMTPESKTRKSETAPSEPAVTTDNDLAETQTNKKCAMPNILKSKTINPPESSVVTEKDPKETEIQYQEEKTNSLILLPREKILENINKRPQWHEEHEKFAVGHCSKILSISPMENKESFTFPSVTHILNATMSADVKKMLNRWMESMISKLGQEGFDKYKRDVIQNGKLLHLAINHTLRKSPANVPDNLKSCFNSVKMVLDEVQNVRAIESQVVHQNLGYRGVVDCVASYRGNLCLIDWKKSNKTKYQLNSAYDAPLQIASYVGALNADKNYPFQIKTGLLVIAYTVGNAPTVLTLDQTKLRYYWKQWLGRLKKYYTVQNT